jgi:uncharacterized protein YndB with AHSA1/START domain
MNIQDVYAREIVTTRILIWPVAKVWQAWTTAETIAKWWGPRGFLNTIHRFDCRPGGEWHLTMHGPDGVNYPNELVFLAVDQNERLVIEHKPDPHFLLTVHFEAFGEGTKVTFRQLFETQEVLSMVRTVCVAGNEDNFDRLEKVLA